MCVCVYIQCEFDDAPADGASCWDPQQARSRCGSGTVYAQRQLQRRAAAGGCGLWQSAEGWHGDGWEDTVLHTDVELKTRKRTSSPSKVKVIKADRQQTTESDASQLDGGSQSTGPKKRRPPSGGCMRHTTHTNMHERAHAHRHTQNAHPQQYKTQGEKCVQVCVCRGAQACHRRGNSRQMAGPRVPVKNRQRNSNQGQVPPTTRQVRVPQNNQQGQTATHTGRPARG